MNLLSGLLFGLRGLCKAGLRALSNYVRSRTPADSTRTVTPASINTSGMANFHHVLSGTRPSARPPATTANVGVTRLIRPLADWYAVTTSARGTPAKSASGAMIGMLTVARPEDDGMRNDRGRYIAATVLMKATPPIPL